jgi:hypothetical protein
MGRYASQSEDLLQMQELRGEGIMDFTIEQQFGNYTVVSEKGIVYATCPDDFTATVVCDALSRPPDDYRKKSLSETDADNLADIVWWIKGFMAGSDASEELCPFGVEHIASLNKARSLAQTKEIRMPF